MKAVKDNNYVQIAGWMINRLNLSGNELYCYAIIYGFSQDGDSFFMGSLKYLEQWMNVSQPTVLKALKGLTEKGLIKKHDIIKDKVKLCYYQAIENALRGTKESLEGGTKESLEGGTKESLDNNNSVILNNPITNKDKIKEEKNILSNDNNKSDDLFDLLWKKYKKGSKKAALKAWNKLKDKQKELALNNVDAYLIFCKRSDRSIKDVSTYLNGECFNDDWSAIPECYQVDEFIDSERIQRFKRYMVSKFPDLIYHRNPLTYEQCDELFDEYGVGPFEEVRC